LIIEVEKVMLRGFTVWFTGLPNAGKTTLSQLVEQELKSRGFPVEVLDGNQLRDGLSPGLGFSRQDREDHNRRVAYLCSRLNHHGVVCVVAVIAPYLELRRELRQKIGEYVEVFLDCPQEVLVSRDRKDLYQRALAGKLPNFTGISDPYEPPLEPELALRTDQLPVEECCQQVMAKLKELGYLDRAQGYTPEEEAQVGKRLKDLGYI
jgi:adenylylsulfate kinase